MYYTYNTYAAGGAPALSDKSVFWLIRRLDGRNSFITFFRLKKKQQKTKPNVTISRFLRAPVGKRYCYWLLYSVIRRTGFFPDHDGSIIGRTKIPRYPVYYRYYTSRRRRRCDERPRYIIVLVMSRRRRQPAWYTHTPEVLKSPPHVYIRSQSTYVYTIILYNIRMCVHCRADEPRVGWTMIFTSA